MLGSYKKIILFLLTLQMSGHLCGKDRGAVHFESPFPNSPYRGVYKLCIGMWQLVRLANSKDMSDEQWQKFNYAMIDSLILLHGRVGDMIESSTSCSPDDLEHLMGVLHVMHVEYRAAYHKRMNDEAICGVVLFNRIQQKLEEVLQ